MNAQIINKFYIIVLRSFSYNDGKNGEKYDILCGTFNSGINEFWSHSTGNFEP